MGETTDIGYVQIHALRMTPVVCVTSGSPGNNQLLYFTSTSLTADGGYMVFISDRTGHPNLFVLDFHTCIERQLTFNTDGLLKSYVYFDGHPYRGFGKASVCLDDRNGIAYYIQGRQICAVNLEGKQWIVAELPPDQMTAFTHVSVDGTRLCVPTTDARVLDSGNQLKGKPDYDIDERVQKENLSSYLRVFDTCSGNEICCIQVPNSWITHVQFSPADHDVILYNHEWPADCGIRRMWLWDGKRHIQLRTEGDGRKRDDWVCHEMWEHDGKGIIYHGRYANGSNFIGRVCPDGSGLAEIQLPDTWKRYGHFTVGNPGELVSDGCYSQAEDSNAHSNGEWISLIRVDWMDRRIDWFPICRSGSSWDSQDSHPHPIFDFASDSILFTSDKTGKRAIFRVSTASGDKQSNRNLSKQVQGDELMHPLVSVVMSVYNGERYLRESVDSILNQTYTNFEFIIVNDGSTDGTREILESYQDERLVLVHQENSGLTKALNNGIAVAKGKYIARQDADDISKPDRLEKQVAFMEGNPSVGLLGSRFEFIDASGNVTRQSMLPTDNDVLQERLARINQFCHASALIRREAIGHVGGYRDFFRYAQDYDLWLRIAEHFEIANLPDVLVQYRELEDAISSEKILLQSRYAWAAAECAQQRRETGTDDLDRGLTPELPHSERFSENLQKKLTDFYAHRPKDMLDGLWKEDERKDLEFLFVCLCGERISLGAEVKQKDEQIRQKDEQVLQKGEQVRQKVEQVRQKDEQIRQKDEQLSQKDGQVRQKDEQLRQKDEQICQKDDQLSRKDEQLSRKDEQIRQKDEQIRQKDEQIRQKDEQIRQKDEQIVNCFGQIKMNAEQIRQKDDELLQKRNKIEELHKSMSWKVTKPLRSMYETLTHIGRK